MLKSDLSYEYPESLVAQSPQRPSRVLFVNSICQPSSSDGAELNTEFCELTPSALLTRFEAGDLLVVNETKVLRRRIFAGDGSLEIVFLKPQPSEMGEGQVWQVLFPCQKFKLGEEIQLPEGVHAQLLEKGRPQLLRTSTQLSESYFERNGELPIPPYIQRARQERHNVNSEAQWYQTAWAKEPGSLAAPTASLHFSAEDLAQLRERGVRVGTLTLHVGLGTFLPLTADKLADHEMHSEWIEISSGLLAEILATRKSKKKVWALGTTVARALESQARGLLAQTDEGFVGDSRLFIYPPFDFKVVDVLLTNFHQPESTLLALVFAFAGVEKTKRAYQWAIQNRFRLFSYGDLSVWSRQS